jgi:hypothetical protein
LVARELSIAFGEPEWALTYAGLVARREPHRLRREVRRRKYRLMLSTLAAATVE